MSTFSSTPVVRLGTRGSPLALWQTRSVAEALEAQHADIRTELVIIRTAGDRNRRDPLAQLGGKGLFVTELEEALLHHHIDVAVHSMKDMPTELPPGLHFGAIPQRAEVRDAFVGRAGQLLTECTEPWRIGTGSMRRQAQLLARYRMLHMQDLRGNVDTRLRKVQHGEVDGAILAAVGLIRLGLAQHITEILPLDLMLPAVGQGALAVETRAGDWVDELLAPLHHAPTAYAITAERAFLTHLGGGCMVPIAALGECQHDVLHLQGLVSTPQGDRMLRHQVQGPAHHAEALGQRLAAQLLEAGADEILQGG